MVLLLACSTPDDPAATSDCAVTLAADGDRLTVDAGGCGQAELVAEPFGTGELTVRMEADDDRAWPVVSGEGALEGVRLYGTVRLAGSEAPRWWRQGYQSWSWSGVVEPEPPAVDERGVEVVGGDDGLYGPVDETAATSWWAGLLGRRDGSALHVGQADWSGDRHLKTWLATDGSTLTVGWGRPGTSVPVSAEAPVALDSVRFAFGDDPFGLWAAWAEATAAAMGARVPAEPPPLGWSDWYAWYGTATEADLLANLEVAVSRGLGLFQVDDGWEMAWGDWTAGPGFPSGTADLAARIRAQGLSAGLWMAPLYVDRATATFTEHPDWWVRDPETGEPLAGGPCDCAVLDVTDPEAVAWMQEQVRAKVAEGWSYLKLDFLYAGAMEGERDLPLTGIEAYQEAARRLREAAGEETWILACGAPMLPSVGFADSFRTGADIAFEPTPDPDPAFLRWQARATAARSWSNGRWWWNDADNLLVREPLTEVEVTGALAAQMVSGGSWILGDDLVTADPGRLDRATASALVAYRGVSARPDDPLAFPGGVDGSPAIERGLPDDRVPVRWVMDEGTVVLLNLSDSEVEAEAPGGVELFSGTTAEAGPRTLAPGAGEVWAPAR